MTAATLSNPLRQFVGVVADAQTYRNLTYLALAFPLGLLYFTGTILGVSTGVGMLITPVGIPILVATLAATTVVAGFEARLAKGLLGIEANQPAVLRGTDGPSGLPRSIDELGDALSTLVAAPTTWTSVLLVSMKFAYGLLGFVALLTTASVTGTLLAAPFLYDTTVTMRLGHRVVDTLPEALAGFAIGVFLLFVGLHVLNALARLGGILTAALLDVGSDSA